MNKLLNANFFKLKKDMLFWIFLFTSVILAFFFVYRNYSNQTPLYQAINYFIILIGMFLAIFVSIFVGKEYSSGIIRNKIIVRS